MTTNLIEYDVKEAKIAEMSDTRDAILKQYEADGNIEPVEAARKEPAKIRIAIEKKRKELKADALKYGRKVDSEAKKVSEPVSQIELSYNTIINEHKAELDRLALLAKEKEEARIATIQARIKRINEFVESALTLNTSESISDLIDQFTELVNEKFNFQEFSEDANNATEEVRGRLHRLFDVKAAHEAEQLELEKQRKKDEANRAKFEAERAEFEKAQAKANAKIEAEQKKLEAAKQLAEREECNRKQAEVEKQRQIELQKERDELDRQRMVDEENRIKAEKAEAERIAQIEKEALERKIKQEAEDRVRNVAPDLLIALQRLLDQSRDIHGVMGEYVNMPCNSLLAKFPTSLVRLESSMNHAIKLLNKIKSL